MKLTILLPSWHMRVQVALAHASRLLAAGVQPASIGIITPYNAQVRVSKRDLFCGAQHAVC